MVDTRSLLLFYIPKILEGFLDKAVPVARYYVHQCLGHVQLVVQFAFLGLRESLVLSLVQLHEELLSWIVGGLLIVLLLLLPVLLPDGMRLESRTRNAPAMEGRVLRLQLLAERAPPLVCLLEFVFSQ